MRLAANIGLHTIAAGDRTLEGGVAAGFEREAVARADVVMRPALLDAVGLAARLPPCLSPP